MGGKKGEGKKAPVMHPVYGSRGNGFSLGGEREDNFGKSPMKKNIIMLLHNNSLCL
jgi:hypothetical protein